MSLMSLLGVRNTILSFVEIVLFFCTITVACVVGPIFIYAAIYQATAKAPLESFWDLWAWFRIAPVWVCLISASVYLSTITIYWAPGEKGDDETELRALVVFLLVAVAGVLIYLEAGYGAVSHLAAEFWRIMHTRGG